MTVEKNSVFWKCWFVSDLLNSDGVTRLMLLRTVFVELSLNVELLFTACLRISPYSLVTVAFCRFSLASVTMESF